VGKMIGKQAKVRKTMNTLSNLAEIKEECGPQKKSQDRKGWQELKRSGAHIPVSHHIS